MVKCIECGSNNVKDLKDKEQPGFHECGNCGLDIIVLSKEEYDKLTPEEKKAHENDY